jgi:transcription factor TFIIIB component B''
MTTLSRMTGKDFSGPVPEIRAPTPHIEVDSAPVDAQESPPPDSAHKKRRSKRKTFDDDGVVVVGDAGSFVPFPESP